MIRETYVMRNGELVPKRLAPPLHVSAPASYVISDIESYVPVAADKHNGERPIIGGRRQHREFLQRNGYIEVGNEVPRPSRESLSSSERIADLKRALGD